MILDERYPFPLERTKPRSHRKRRNIVIVIATPLITRFQLVENRAITMGPWYAQQNVPKGIIARAIALYAACASCDYPLITSPVSTYGRVRRWREMAARPFHELRQTQFSVLATIPFFIFLPPSFSLSLLSREKFTLKQKRVIRRNWGKE